MEGFSMSINHVSLSGYLTSDADVRQTAKGTTLISFQLAFGEMNRSTEENKKRRPNYINCVMFGVRGERLAEYLRTSRKVAVDGKLRWSEWIDKDNNKRNSIELVVDNLEFFDSNKKAADKTPEPGAFLANVEAE